MYPILGLRLGPAGPPGEATPAHLHFSSKGPVFSLRESQRWVMAPQGCLLGPWVSGQEMGDPGHPEPETKVGIGQTLGSLTSVRCYPQGQPM